MSQDQSQVALMKQLFSISKSRPSINRDPKAFPQTLKKILIPRLWLPLPHNFLSPPRWGQAPQTSKDYHFSPKRDSEYPSQHPRRWDPACFWAWKIHLPCEASAGSSAVPQRCDIVPVSGKKNTRVRHQHVKAIKCWHMQEYTTHPQNTDKWARSESRVEVGMVQQATPRSS